MLCRAPGLVISSINSLHFELHIPAYKYCGPGTILDKRLARNHISINPYEEGYKVHDISYATSSRLEDRYEADKILVKLFQNGDLHVTQTLVRK